jgi:hypothetical protein
MTRPESGVCPSPKCREERDSLAGLAVGAASLIRSLGSNLRL